MKSAQVRTIEPFAHERAQGTLKHWEVTGVDDSGVSRRYYLTLRTDGFTAVELLGDRGKERRLKAGEVRALLPLLAKVP
jgi:hypothetical protein